MKKLGEKISIISLYSVSIKQLKSLLITAVLFVFITAGLIEGSIVPTPSMESTILVGDRLLINKFVFGASTPSYIPFTNINLPHFRLPSLRDPRRDEIIVFRFPGDQIQLKDDEVEFWIKRCVAIPGDTIEIRNKVIYVNGIRSKIPPNILYQNQPIKRNSETNTGIFPPKSGWNEDNYGPLVIPRSGDIINLSSENINEWKTLINREFGRNVVNIINNEVRIEGEIVKKYTIKEDYYFTIGDNRDNSYDSRFWGYVPRKNIVGTPIIVFWSWDSDIPFSRPLDLLSSIRFDRIAKLVK